MNFKWRIFKHGWKEFCQWMIDYWSKSTAISADISVDCWTYRRDNPSYAGQVEYFNEFGIIGYNSWIPIMGEETQGHFIILQ